MKKLAVAGALALLQSLSAPTWGGPATYNWSFLPTKDNTTSAAARGVAVIDDSMPIVTAVGGSYGAPGTNGIDYWDMEIFYSNTGVTVASGVLIRDGTVLDPDGYLSIEFLVDTLAFSPSAILDMGPDIYSFIMWNPGDTSVQLVPDAFTRYALGDMSDFTFTLDAPPEPPEVPEPGPLWLLGTVLPAIGLLSRWRRRAFENIQTPTEVVASTSA